jgi:ribonuclease VapC
MEQPSPVFVFDTHALLAFILDEPGAAAVQERLLAARDSECLVLVSAMSVGEVCYIIERRNGIEAVEASLALLEALPIRIVEVDRPTILSAARIKARHPISLGDAFVVALAVDRGATVVTGDREFKRVEQIVSVLWLS